MPNNGKPTKFTEDELKEIREAKEELRRKTTPYIKFEDGETKILEFYPREENGKSIWKPTDERIDYKTGRGEEIKKGFMAIECDLKTGKHLYEDTHPWPVGSKLAAQVLDSFSDGDSKLEIKRVGGKGDLTTYYRIQRSKV